MPGQSEPIPQAMSTPPTHRSTRRQMLRLAGGTIGGVALASAMTSHAAADNGLTIATAGATTSDEFTKVTFSGTPTGGHLFLFRSDTTAFDTATGSSKAVLTGASTLSSHAGVFGVHTGSGGGVRGQSNSSFGVGGTSETGSGIHGVTTSGDALQLSVISTDANHVRFSNTGVAMTPFDRPSRATAAPSMTVFSDRSLWYCTTPGTPGEWRKMVGPTTAGAFHSIATARVYDSRKTMTPMVNGIITTGTSRVIDVSDKRDTSTGAVVLADVVPDHATTVAYNLTIVTTVGTNGFLGVEPGDAVAAGGSAINWSAAGLTLANASVAKLDASRQLKVFCGGAATSCHFIIDIVGYYL